MMRSAIRALSLATATAFLFAGCGDQVRENIMGSPPAASATMTLSPVPDQGLTARDISGISASDFTTAGTGTASNDPETITVSVPSGAAVTSVFLYWSRRIVDPSSAPASEITVDGTTVSGTIVGGPIQTSDGLHAPTTYLADLTGDGLIGSGSTTFSVEDDAPGAMGASVLVFYDDGETPETLALYDGVDFLWGDDPSGEEALRTAEPVTFSLSSDDNARPATLRLFVGDVEPGGVGGHSLTVTVGSQTTTLSTPFSGSAGANWDDFTWDFTVPSGATEVTVQPVSPSGGGESLVWAAAGLSVQPPEEPEGGEGCTPGYWRQPHHFDSWPNPFDPDDSLSETFDIPEGLRLARPEHRTDPGSLTLSDAVTLRGGKVNALIRHAVAALLNAASEDVSYDLTVDEVVEKFEAAVAGGDVRGTKGELEGFNEQGCPLD